MDWKLDRSKPICPQICEAILAGISSGEFAPGARLMSVREVALAAGVNPNTAQKSFEELERIGAVYSVRGSGWFVSEDTSAASKHAEETVRERVAAFFADMKRLGVSSEETKQYVKEWSE